MLLIPPVLFLLLQVKMSAVKSVCCDSTLRPDRATHTVGYISDSSSFDKATEKASQRRQTGPGVSLAVRSQNGSMTYCMCVCMWLCVCCYYGESLRWHKLHSSWTKQPLYYLCLHVCLLCSPPHLSPHFVTSLSFLPPSSPPPNFPQLSLKCKHITTSIFFFTAGAGHAMCSHSHYTQSWNIFKSLVILMVSQMT